MSVDRIDSAVRLRARTSARRRPRLVSVPAPGRARVVPSIEAAALVRVARAAGSLRSGGTVAPARTVPAPRPVRRQLSVVPGERWPSGDERLARAGGAGVVARVSPRRERYAPVRLTRRGRVVARLTLILTALLVLVGVAAGAKAMADSPSSEGSRTAVVVEPGDTLWNIAERHAPDADRRSVIAEIRRLNHLENSTVEVGQELLLPRR